MAGMNFGPSVVRTHKKKSEYPTLEQSLIQVVRNLIVYELNFHA